MSKTVRILKAQIEKLKFIEASRISDKELSALETMTGRLTKNIEAQKLWRENFQERKK